MATPCILVDISLKVTLSKAGQGIKRIEEPDQTLKILENPVPCLPRSRQACIRATGARHACLKAGQACHSLLRRSLCTTAPCHACPVQGKHASIQRVPAMLASKPGEYATHRIVVVCVPRLCQPCFSGRRSCRERHQAVTHLISHCERPAGARQSCYSIHQPPDRRRMELCN